MSRIHSTYAAFAATLSAARPGLSSLLLAALISVFPHFLHAQQTPQDWGAFVQQVDVSAWQGHKFKVTAAVRAQCLDDKAGAEIWVRIDKSDKTMGYFNNMMDKPIRDSQWKVYTLIGKVDKKAKMLAFGGLYQHKGNFWFDDFHVYIEGKGSEWQELPLKDGGFEGDTAEYNKSWGFFRERKFFAPHLNPDTPYEGHMSVKVDGTQFNPAATRTYGNNDSVGRFITANGIRLYVETYGKGQPLLLLHGNSSDIATFYKQIPVFAKQYQVIAVDSRGQGKSGEDGKTYTYDLFAEDMNALLDTLHLDSVDIVGWSDGGNTGLIMAMKYPRKVRKLASMGANVFIDNTVVDRWVFDTLRNQQIELKTDTTPWGINRNRLITMLLTEPRHSFDELGAIHCPVLVMAGQHDVIRPGHTKAIAKHIPGSTLLIFPKGTHYEPEQNPTRFNQAVLDFFAGAPPAK